MYLLKLFFTIFKYFENSLPMFSSPSYGDSSTRLAFPNLKWNEITARLIFKSIVPFLTNTEDLISVTINQSKLNEEALIAVAHFKDIKTAEAIYIALDGVEIENTGCYFDPRFLHRETGEKISECTQEPEDIVACDVFEEEDMDRKNKIMSLFDEEDEEFNSDIINELVEMSNDENNKKDRNTVLENVEVVTSEMCDSSNSSNDKPKNKKQKILEHISELKNNENTKKNKESNTKQKISKFKKDKIKKNLGCDEKNFELNLDDERFKRVFIDEEFKVDVTHNLYKNNPSVKKVMREKRKRQCENE